jgi:hypothetical protein
MITALEPQSTFDAAMADCDVMYISVTTVSGDLADKDLNPALGIVSEEPWLYDEMKISQGGHADYGNDSFWIVDDTHDITSGLGTGPVELFRYFQWHGYTDGALAPDARVLSQWPGYDATTVVVEAGGELLDGVVAKARRVALPWGFTDFETDAHTSNSRTIMRRSIEWAAAPVGFSGATIALQIGPDAASRVEIEVRLLNEPEVR